MDHKLIQNWCEQKGYKTQVSTYGARIKLPKGVVIFPNLNNKIVISGKTFRMSCPDDELFDSIERAFSFIEGNKNLNWNRICSRIPNVTRGEKALVNNCRTDEDAMYGILEYRKDKQRFADFLQTYKNHDCMR